MDSHMFFSGSYICYRVKCWINTIGAMITNMWQKYEKGVEFRFLFLKKSFSKWLNKTTMIIRES